MAPVRPTPHHFPGPLSGVVVAAGTRAPMILYLYPHFNIQTIYLWCVVEVQTPHQA